MGRQNKELLENIERYEEKKIKQSKSKILGQKPVKRKSNSKQSTRMYHSKRSESIRGMV